MRIHWVQGICRLIFRLKGWRVEGFFSTQEIPKAVIIGAPHTSNWDAVFGVGAFWLQGLWPRFMAKKELFFPPIGRLIRALGGIPVDRSKKTSLTEQVVRLLDATDALYVMVPPEGTRQRVEQWKSGFYRIAVQAKVPIALGYLDYRKKAAGFLGVFYPTGDYEADLKVIQACYRGVIPKYAAGWGLPEEIWKMPDPIQHANLIRLKLP